MERAVSFYLQGFMPVMSLGITENYGWRPWFESAATKKFPETNNLAASPDHSTPDKLIDQNRLN